MFFNNINEKEDRIPEQTNHVKTEPDIDEMVKFINTNEEEAKSLEQADIAKIVHGIEDEFGEMGKDIDILRKEKEAKSILIKKYQRYKILNR